MPDTDKVGTTGDAVKKGTVVPPAEAAPEEEAAEAAAVEKELATLPLLTKEAILDAQDEEVKYIPVPLWGGKVRLKSMKGYERDTYETACIGSRKKVHGRMQIDMKLLKALLLSKCIVDENGAPQFTDAGQIIALNKKNSAVIDMLFEEACALNGMDQKDVDKLAKNSESETEKSSGSGSLGSVEEQLLS